MRVDCLSTAPAVMWLLQTNINCRWNGSTRCVGFFQNILFLCGCSVYFWPLGIRVGCITAGFQLNCCSQSAGVPVISIVHCSEYEFRWGYRYSQTFFPYLSRDENTRCYLRNTLWPPVINMGISNLVRLSEFNWGLAEKSICKMHCVRTCTQRQCSFEQNIFFSAACLIQ